MSEKSDRIEELQEKENEFILNESVFADDHPSWLEVAEAQAEAEGRWNETDEGKELKALLDSLREEDEEFPVYHDSQGNEHQEF